MLRCFFGGCLAHMRPINEILRVVKNGIKFQISRSVFVGVRISSRGGLRDDCPEAGLENDSEKREHKLFDEVQSYCNSDSDIVVLKFSAIQVHCFKSQAMRNPLWL